MKCMSCEETIPSKFTHAIKSNTCPFCGAEIMEAALQTILSSLQTLMKEAEPYIDVVEEWFASNYSLRKGNKTSQDDDNFDEDSIKKQTEAAKSAIAFQQRAGIKAGNDVKSLIDKIQNGKGAADPSEFVGIDEDYGPVDYSKDEPGQPLSKTEALTMMQALNQAPTQTSDDPLKDYYEIQKLKKLQRVQPTGQGKFSRGD